MARRTATLLALGPLILGGCVANSSNPSVAVHEARLAGGEAMLDLEITNPGGRDLVVTAVEYQLAHGETSFPVADGRWNGDLPLPAGRSARLDLRVSLAVEPLEPDSRRLHLSGTLHLEDRTGFLGLRSMDLTRTPFQVEAEAKP